MTLFENDWVDCAAKAVLITGGIFIFIAGCVVLCETPTNAPRNSSNATQIERHEFKDDGVVCYNYDNIPIRLELESYDDVNFLTPADIFATDWEEW